MSANTDCTIIIVNPRKGQSQSLTIATRHVYYAKYYAALLMLIVLGLMAISAVLYAINERQQAERRILASELQALQQQVPKTADTLNAQDYVKRIEVKLHRINEYLRKRGLKGFAQEAVGGQENNELKLAPTEYYNLYDQHLERIFEGLTYTPTGFPAKPELTSTYGYRSNPFHAGIGEFHSGIDFRGKKGDLVKSTANGEVVYAGRNGGYGLCVQIKHRNGYETLYGHLSKCLVKSGDRIAAGQAIGEIGSTGRSTGSHLHYEVRKNNRPVNPMEFLELD